MISYLSLQTHSLNCPSSSPAMKPYSTVPLPVQTPSSPAPSYFSATVVSSPTQTPAPSHISLTSSFAVELAEQGVIIAAHPSTPHTLCYGVHPQALDVGWFGCSCDSEARGRGRCGGIDKGGVHFLAGKVRSFSFRHFE